MDKDHKDDEQEKDAKKLSEQQIGNDNDLSTVLRPDALCPFTLYLHWCQLNGCNVGGVHHGFGTVGSVCQEALPLLWQPSELLLPWVEACVDPVFKVRWS